MPSVVAEACAIGHVAPVWTEAARAVESPTEGRCVEGATLGDRREVWSLCGGLALTGRVPAPAVCPVAPGGLAVKRIADAASDWLWSAPDAAVVLDCPGRYRLTRSGEGVSVTLVESGATACGAGLPRVSVAGWPQPDPTGLSIQSMRELPSDFLVFFPEPLRAGAYADAVEQERGLSGTVVWQTGRFPLRVAGFDLEIGRDTAWQALDFVLDAGALSLSLAPARLRVRPLRDGVGEPLQLATWTRLGWSAERSWLDDSLPVRLPASRACGARIAAGTMALLKADDAPTSNRACRRAPSTSPDVVYIGPDWVYLDWNVAPASVRTAAPQRNQEGDWRWESDNGCDLVCR